MAEDIDLAYRKMMDARRAAAGDRAIRSVVERRGIVKSVTDPFGVFGKVRNGILSTAEDLAEFMGTSLDLEALKDPIPTSEELSELQPGASAVRDIASFGISLYLPDKALKGLKMYKTIAEGGAFGRFVTGTAVGAGADFVVADPQEENLFSLLKDLGLTNDVIDYLAIDPEEDDSNLHNRIKNVIEGGALSGVLTVGGSGIMKALDLSKHVIKGADGLLGPEARKAADLKLATGKQPTDAEISKALAKEAGPAQQVVTKFESTGWESLNDAEKHRMAGEFLRAFEAGDAGKEVFNPRRMAPGEAMEIINLMSKQNPSDALRPTRTLAESQANAIKLLGEVSTEPEKMLAFAVEHYNITSDSDAKLNMLKTYLRGLGDEVLAGAKKSLSGNASDLDRLQFVAQLSHLWEIQPFIEGSISNQARGLGSLRAVIDGQPYRAMNLSREVIEQSKDGAEQIAKILERFGSKDGIDKLAKQALVAKDIKGLPKALKESGGQRVLNALIEWRMINMLSGIPTHAVNSLSNMLRLVNDQIVSPAIQAGVYHLNPTAQGLDPTDLVSFHEILDRIRGIQHEIWNFGSTLGSGGWRQMSAWLDRISVDPRGTRIAAEGLPPGALKTSYLLGREPGEIPMVGLLFKFFDLAGSAGRMVSYGALEASDAFFKNANYRAEVFAATERLARKYGGSNEAKNNFVKSLREDIKLLNDDSVLALEAAGRDEQRIRDVIKIHQESLARAKESVFQGDLSPGWERLGKAMGSESYRWTKIFIPFYKTPMNILKFVGQRTPLIHKLSKQMRDDLAGLNGHVAQTEAVSKMIQGMVLYGTGMSLAATGLITGSHPREHRDGYLAANIPEYSVYVGDRWVKYNRMDPLGLFIGISADLYNIAGDVEELSAKEITGSLIAVLAENSVNKTWMQSVGDVVKAFQEPERYGDRVFLNLVRPSLPTLGPAATARSINMAMDPHFREVRSLVDAYQQDSLFLSDKAPIRMSVIGEPVHKDMSALSIVMGLSGLRASVPTASPGVREAARLKALGNSNTPMIMGVRLKREEFQEMKAILNDDLQMRRRLDDLVQSPGYLSLSEAKRTEYIKRLMSEGKTAAKQLLLDRNPALLQQVEEKFLHTQRLLETEGLAALPEGTLEGINEILGYDIDRFLRSD